MPAAGYFETERAQFSLLRAGALPVREAQLGALHALGAHFSLRDGPAIVALPTGVGKTVVGAAAPFVIPGSSRALYVVPTRVLRQDTVANLTNERQLRAVGLLSSDAKSPRIIDIDAKPSGWDRFLSCDMAVALPNSLFELIDDEPPPRDLFDIIVFDEAHHVPARTWDLISNAFRARQVLLTATPYRRDQRELPGELAYSYPLERAIAAGAYVPIELVGVETIGMSSADVDRAIATRAVQVLHGDAHRGTSSKLLIRASTKARVEALVGLYEELGTSIAVVHSGLSATTVAKRIEDVRGGVVDGIAFVGVLGEGFDCPQLKVGAYHDKHKSLPVTLQFLGRLSRVCADAGPPQVVASVETLRSDTWSLWRRDSDWARIIPRISETAAGDVQRRKQLLATMDEFPHSEVSVNDIVIRPSLGLYQVEQKVNDLEPPADFGLDTDGVAATGLVTGGSFAGGNIVWSHLNVDEQFLMFVTSHRERPDWLRSHALDTERFELHVALVRKGPDAVPVVAVSSITRKREAEIMSLLAGGADRFGLATPDLMRRFLSVAQIGNVLHLGTRKTGGGSQARTYTTNSGRAVEDDLTYEDLRDDVVGHVGALCYIGDQHYNGGVSIGNSRLWVIKRFAIDGYIDFVSGLLRDMGAGQPGEIRRLNARFEGVLTDWPLDVDPVAVALDEYFLTDVSDVAGIAPADLDLRATPPQDGLLGLEIPSLGWTARVRTNGTFAEDNKLVDVETTTGVHDLVSLLTEYPPVVYYRNGATSRGARLVPAPPGIASPPLRSMLKRWSWTRVNIEHETQRGGPTMSIHEKVEAELLAGSGAWLLVDDASGEIADHIMIEAAPDGERLQLGLFHSKASSDPSPGVRTVDFDELIGQMVRSKRWVGLADGRFWARLAKRVVSRASTRVIGSPTAHTVNDFRDACRAWIDRPPIVSISYVGVQPGLDVQRLLDWFEGGDERSARLAETLGSCAAWIGGANASVEIVGS